MKHTYMHVIDGYKWAGVELTLGDSTSKEVWDSEVTGLTLYNPRFVKGRLRSIERKYIANDAVQYWLTVPGRESGIPCTNLFIPPRLARQLGLIPSTSAPVHAPEPVQELTLESLAHSDLPLPPRKLTVSDVFYMLSSGYVLEMSNNFSATLPPRFKNFFASYDDLGSIIGFRCPEHDKFIEDWKFVSVEEYLSGARE